MQLGPIACLVIAGICAVTAVATARRLAGKPAQGTESRVSTDQHAPEGDPTPQDCVAWLKSHMPQADTGYVSDQRLLEHAKLALAARSASPWATAVPLELWFNNVLPYRNLDEPIDVEDWRPMFFERFMPLVAEANSLTEAAQILNRDIWALWGLHFVPDKSPEIMSPAQVLAHGYASCTGLSIFLADACRAVGIPARVAGTPSWVADRRDSPEERFNNHNWVEIWDGSTWSFTGALEYNAAGLNRTWFFPQPAKGQIPGSHWHAIYAASFQKTATVFPLAWAPEDTSVSGVDVTQAYIDAAVLPSSATPDAVAATAPKPAPVSAAVAAHAAAQRPDGLTNLVAVAAQ